MSALLAQAEISTALWSKGVPPLGGPWSRSRLKGELAGVCPEPYVMSTGMLCEYACMPSHLPPSLTLPARSLIVFGRSVIYLCTVAILLRGDGVTGVLGQLDPVERRLNVTNANVLYMSPIS